MLPNVDYIKTVVNGLKQWVENRIKAISGALEKSLDDKIENLPQADWNQNDPKAKDYVKNRICYVKDPILIGKAEFLATSEANVTRTMAGGGDLDFMRKLYDFCLKTEGNADRDILKIKIGEQTFHSWIYFDRGSFFINGEISGSGYYNDGREWTLTIATGNANLITGQSYEITFVNNVEDIVPIPIKYFSKDIFKRGNAPVDLGDGKESTIQGNGTTASGDSSHAEGNYTTASGDSSHAEGNYTTASGDSSHAEGNYTTASGDSSHAEGNHTVASREASHVSGSYNVEDINKGYIQIVGNGTFRKRSNAYTLDENGNGWFSGDVYTGSTSGTNRDDGSKKLATEDYVNAAVAETGETWELIKYIEIADGAAETNALTINTDANGNEFALKKARLFTRFAKYTGETTIPGFSFSMLNDITSGQQSPLVYTSGLPTPSKSGEADGYYEVDLSMAGFQVEKVARFGGAGSRGSIIPYFGERRLNGAETITSIGGTRMLIYPGCKFWLFGVRA